MEQELRALLIAGLQDVPVARINWGQHMATAGGPYVVLNLISLNEGLTMQGPDGLETSRVQMDVYAPTFGEANEMGRRLKSLLHGYQGDGFRLIQFDTMRHLRESGDNAGEAVYRASLDFLTHWRNDDAG